MSMIILWLPLFIGFGALGLRLFLNLSHEGYLGVDGGAYLLSRNTVLGDEPTGAGFPRPPLAPGWLLVPFTEIWGDDVGYKIWSAVAATLPAIPVYLLTRQYVNKAWAPVFAVGFLALDLTHMEMMVTGALPLIGFTLIGLALWGMGKMASDASLGVINVKYTAITALAIGLIPWVNQTSAGIAAIIIPIYWVVLILWAYCEMEVSGCKQGHRIMTALYTLPALVIGALIGLGALPWYLKVAPNSDILHFGGGAWIYPSPLGDVTWIQMALAITVGALVIRQSSDTRIKGLGVILIVLGILCPWLSYDETIINVFYRSGYLMAVIFYPLITWLVFKLWIPKIETAVKPVYAALIVFPTIGAALSWMLVFSVWQHHNQSDYSDMATPATMDALDYLKSQPQAGVITNSFTLSLWVAALNKVHSPFAFTAQPPRAYIQDDKDIRCLLGWVPECDPLASQQRLKVGYILIDQRFPFLNDRSPGNYLAPDNQWEVTASAPWLTLRYREGTTRLWAISPMG